MRGGEEDARRIQWNQRDRRDVGGMIEMIRDGRCDRKCGGGNATG